MQRQLSATFRVEADYVFVGGRDEQTTQGTQLNNVDFFYNPLTQVSSPFTDINRRPFPDSGALRHEPSWALYELPLTADGVHQAVEASVGQTCGRLHLVEALWLVSAPPVSGNEVVPFPVAADLGGNPRWEPTVCRPRHRGAISRNGIWEVGRGLFLSGLLTCSGVPVSKFRRPVRRRPPGSAGRSSMACVPMGPSSRGILSWATQSTAWVFSLRGHGITVRGGVAACKTSKPSTCFRAPKLPAPTKLVRATRATDYRFRTRASPTSRA